MILIFPILLFTHSYNFWQPLRIRDLPKICRIYSSFCRKIHIFKASLANCTVISVILIKIYYLMWTYYFSCTKYDTRIYLCTIAHVIWGGVTWTLFIRLIQDYCRQTSVKLQNFFRRRPKLIDLDWLGIGAEVIDFISAWVNFVGERREVINISNTYGGKCK